MKNVYTAMIIFSASTLSFAGAGGAKHGHNSTHWDAPSHVAYTQYSRQQGEDIFNKNCVSCHGVKGRGDGPLASAINPKPTNLMAMSGKHKDGDFAWKISTGKGAMPAWKNILKRSEIWHLVNYIQTLSSSMKISQSENKHKHSENHGH